MIFPGDLPKWRRSRFRCVACQTPWAIEEVPGGVWAWCSFIGCKSAMSNEGAISATESEAVARITEAVENEMETATWDAVYPKD